MPKVTVYVDRTVEESPASQVQSRQKSSAPDVPKKKDGRGRPRKDRTLELAKSAGTPVTSAVVGNTLHVISQSSVSIVANIVLFLIVDSTGSHVDASM